MGSLKMSIVVVAAELPRYTPSSRTRSATASGAGADDGVVDGVGVDDRHGWARMMPTPPPKIATTTTAASPTHGQGVRLCWGGGCHGGAPVVAPPQAGAVVHGVGCGTDPPTP